MKEITTTISVTGRKVPQKRLDEVVAILIKYGFVITSRKEAQDLKPPYYNHISGPFTPKLFKSLVEKGFTRFADKDNTHLLVINGGRTTIFVGRERGRTSSWDTKEFMELFDLAKGKSFASRLNYLIRSGDSREVWRSEALLAMPWIRR